MGVYIPNMSKPKSCYNHCFEGFIADKDIGCPLNDYIESHQYKSRIHPNCPLIEIDLVRCGECKYFNLNEWDETICGVPIIVAHEICHKWGDGCKTNIYGFCFMGERRADGDI